MQVFELDIKYNATTIVAVAKPLCMPLDKTSTPVPNLTCYNALYVH